MEANEPYIVVVGVDYSEPSELALTRALELASREPRGEVHAVNVVRGQGDSVFVELTTGLAVVSLKEAADRIRNHVAQKVEGLAARSRVCERIVTHLGYGSPAVEIAQLASDLEADLVVVGTHGHRGVQRLFLGSVAESTVRLSPVPVLVVRKKHAALDAVPRIEPPCPRCVEARKASAGKQLWCDQHLERHGRRHTYHQIDRNASSRENMPLFIPE